MFQQTLEQVVRSTWQSEPAKTQVVQQESRWSMVQEDINKTWVVDLPETQLSQSFIQGSDSKGSGI